MGDKKHDRSVTHETSNGLKRRHPDASSSVRKQKLADVALSPETRAVCGLYALDGDRLNKYTDIVGLREALIRQTKAIEQGDSSYSERMLYSQAATLEALFVGLLDRAVKQDWMPNIEVLLKYALRAQNQSRATLDTLATIKAQPAIYAHQANISHGPQQVNNDSRPEEQRRVGKIQKAPNELLEQIDGKRLDTPTTCKTGGADSELAAVEISNRADDIAG